ncbi:MAG: RNA polymerase sigma factor [Bryobacteraceae bacterium]
MDPGFAASNELPLDMELAFAMRNSSALKQKVAKVFELLRDPVYRYLYRVLDSPQEAEDLTQEVFLRLYVALHKGQAVANIRAWVFRVAHNLAIDQQRRKIQYEPMELAGPREAPDPAPGVEEQVLTAEKHERLRLAITSLSLEEKHCLELRAEGLSYREIADILDMRMPTLVKYLGRIVKKLIRGTAND